MCNLCNRVTRAVFWRPDAIYMVTQLVTQSPPMCNLLCNQCKKSCNHLTFAVDVEKIYTSEKPTATRISNSLEGKGGKKNVRYLADELEFYFLSGQNYYIAG